MVNVDNINLENLSVADLTALEERIRVAKLKPTGMRLVGLLIALKEALSAIKEIDEGVLGEQLSSIPAQALPKHNLIGKRYGLSETETKNAGDKAAKAIEAL